MWFSSFHKKSPFRDFKIWDGRTTLAAPRVKRQFRVLLHVALPQSQKRSSLRSACAEPIKSLRFFTSRPYLQNKKRIRKIPILFLSGMEGLSCSFAFNGTSFICCINSIYFANKPPPSAHSRSHQNKAFALWFSSFHKKSPFRDFKIWDGRTRTSECLDQNQVPYHLATSQYNYYSTL